MFTLRFAYYFKLSLIVLLPFSVISQTTKVAGSVINISTFKPIEGVSIVIDKTNISTTTSTNGQFQFSGNLPLGEQILILSKQGYKTSRYPIIINKNQTVLVTDMVLEEDVNNIYTVTLTEDELNTDMSGADNISGLLHSSQDVFQRAVAYEFSASFFKLRGLDSNQGTLFINGIEMNKFSNGRPQWNNWGGLNDALRNRDLNIGIGVTQFGFGGLLGTTSINTKASQYRQGGRVTYSNSNRSYSHRLMATYFSGLLEENWAYAVSIGRRWGNEGYQDASLYDANSFFLSVEKQFSKKHSLNLTALYTPNRRGRIAPHTDEVYNLKGIRYNEYWGYLNGKKRNSRISEVKEPILLLNYSWAISEAIILQVNAGIQFGSTSLSRLDYNGTNLVNGVPQGGGANPSPVYYQKLPSYFIKNNPENFDLAYRAQQNFLQDGQIDWDAIYDANLLNDRLTNTAIYALYGDKTKLNKQTIAANILYQPTQQLTFNGAINAVNQSTNYFAEVIDLFGAQSYLDVNAFLDEPPTFQSNLQTPNRFVTEGDVFKYNYNVRIKSLNGFVQAELKRKKWESYLGVNVNTITYQRDGFFENGAFPAEKSFGKGKAVRFTGLGVKGGLTYKFSGKHIVALNAAYIQRAPSIRNVYSNPRENHNIIGDKINKPIQEEQWLSATANYTFRSPFVTAKVTPFYAKNTNANQVRFYFADGVGGDNAVFVQEILQGVKKTYLGLEASMEAQVLSSLKLKGVAAIGLYTFANNPELYLTSQPSKSSINAGFVNGFKHFGLAYLKNYKLSNGPQQAYSLGFEYRDPDYWWFGATANAFSNTHIGVNPLTRTTNFYQDSDGQIFNDYDPQIAKSLLKQEKFKPYMVLNLIGGKTWRIKNYTIGLFASINNVLNKRYKTGGFESGRNANYRQLRDDKALNTPVFGSKYWYARGVNYFINLNVSFY